jgi:DNA-binding NtrC family response regulator
VLSDNSLAIGDGFEIARHIQRRSPGTPVILMTGLIEPGSPQSACQSGAATFVAKAIDGERGAP